MDVVLCVPSCDGPIRKAFDVTGVTPAIAPSGRLNEIAALEPTNGFAGAVINATATPFTEIAISGSSSHVVKESN